MRGLLFALLVVVGLIELAALTSPPTDEELRNSIVDTWQTAAMVTQAALSTLLVLCVIAVAISIFARASRGLAIALALLALLSAWHWTWNHIVLSERAEGLAGIRFGGFYGLF